MGLPFLCSSEIKNQLVQFSHFINKKGDLKRTNNWNKLSSSATTKTQLQFLLSSTQILHLQPNSANEWTPTVMRKSEDVPISLWVSWARKPLTESVEGTVPGEKELGGAVLACVIVIPLLSPQMLFTTKLNQSHERIRVLPMGAKGLN